MTLIYKMQSASKDIILLHLQQCDLSYRPPLSSRVDLREYADKMFARSVSFEAWDRGALVGLVNAYFNGAENRVGFVTNVSVLPEYTGQGVAKKLLRMCLDYGSDRKTRVIRLEVSRENEPAVSVYSNAGFRVVGEDGMDLVMEREIGERVQREG